MADEEFIEIQVTIADRRYPVFVTPNELPIVRELEQQLINEFIDLQARYANKLGKQDILAMLLFTYARKLYDIHLESDTEDMLKLIGRIGQHLDKALSK